MRDHKCAAAMASLVLLSALALPALASEPDTPTVELPVAQQPAETGTAAAEEEEASELPDSVLYYGTVTAIDRDGTGMPSRLTLTSVAYGDYVMNLSADTVWVDCAARTVSDPATLAEGEAVFVFHSPISTRSLPPQSAAYAVVRNISQDHVGAHYHVAEAVEASGDGSVRIVTDRGGLHIAADGGTGLSRYDGGVSLALTQLQTGNRIMVWYSAVAESYPAQTYAQHIMVLPALGAQSPVEGESLTITVKGQPTQLTGRYENGVAVVPVAAVAQALGYEVTYTPRPEGALVTVESDSFQVRLNIGSAQIIGVTKLPDAVGMTTPQDYGVAPYIVDPGITWAPAQLFQLLGRTVELEGSVLSIQ